jgi:diacylglycerol kinase family enzyme
VDSELSQVETHTSVLKEQKKPLPLFGKVGDVLPVELLADEESKGPSFDNIKAGNDWSKVNLKLIQRKKISFEKPVVVIYNPVSGKKKDFVPMITARLKEANISCEFMPTKQNLDPLNFARTIDLDKYSVLVACGGDGTMHEIVNGLLMREDKKQIPISFLPNGSGDDLCSSLGIMSMDIALGYLCKGEAIKIDTVRVMLDHTSEDTLPKGLERLDFCRYMVTNSGCAMPPLVTVKAKPWKMCCGKASYTIAALVEACKGNLVSDTFEVFVDGKQVQTPASAEHSTISLMTFNGKYTGGGMILDPYACVNDGMTDITWVSDPALNNLLGVSGVMDKAKKGATQVYDHQNSYYRGKQILLKFKGKVNRKPPQNGHGR